MDKSEKREIPPMLRTILNLDKLLTQSFVKYVEYIMPMKRLKVHHTALEVSCHGIVWLASLLALIWILNNARLFQMQVNLIIALTLDIIIIGVLKAFTRRRRPAEDLRTFGPDKYSFPSGHVSRAMLIFYFFKYLWPISDIYVTLLLLWVATLFFSRVLMRKHYLLDVTAGLFIGYAEGLFMSLIYLDAKTCASFVSWITDEKMEGAEYDV
ncbi:phospholipid phosphatase 6 isoform X2 [Ceratina calcarata]|uniref:Phospholipid phosphatase 6 isoform X2 n=1 Tax=Ceratina calcarata TaxID=156304 RepID=A0AAJ7NA21_9HYME|nr:phospholipid phosphatase 6 isoform X2 [Ceratina calcarata]